MPATIQQDITLCINATGCHFTGPLALRRSLSTVLPILYLWNYTVTWCANKLISRRINLSAHWFIHRHIIYIIFFISYYCLPLIFPAPLFICYCLLRSQ